MGVRLCGDERSLRLIRLDVWVFTSVSYVGCVSLLSGGES